MENESIDFWCWSFRQQQQAQPNIPQQPDTKLTGGSGEHIQIVIYSKCNDHSINLIINLFPKIEKVLISAPLSVLGSVNTGSDEDQQQKPSQ